MLATPVDSLSSTVEVKRTHPLAILPYCVKPSTKDSLPFYELFSVETVSIPPFSTRSIDAGLSLCVPPGLFGRLVPS